MKKGFLVISIIMSFCLLAASCSLSKADESAPNYQDYDSGYSEEDRVSTEAPKAANYAPGADYGSGEDGGQATSPINDLEDRKLIRDASLRIQTMEFDVFMSNLHSEISAAGGFVQRSDISGRSYTYTSMRSATVVARIPAAKLEDFLGIVSEIGNVINKSELLQDVTMMYVDIESHIRALETEKESLLALMAKAEKVSDIIAIQSQLTSVRYELDNYNSRLRKYDDLISYSTVTMNISEVERLTEVEQKTVWEQISSRLSDSLYAVGRGFRNFFIWFVGSLPYIVVIAVLAVIALFIVKASVKCRRKHKAAKTKE